MTDQSPIILWFRRDLRLGDHLALTEACATGRPIIPVFIHDEVVAATGAAAKMRLGLSIASLAKDISAKGQTLTLRRGKAADVLRAIISETGAGAVWWSRLYDGAAKTRDIVVKSTLKSDGIDARSFGGHVLFEPWAVETKTGGYYRVFSPMWKTVRTRDVPMPLPVPANIVAPESWPESDNLSDWNLDAAMDRGAAVMGPHCVVGETAALDRLAEFIEDRVQAYKLRRDFPGVNATSGLSENLTYGEISPGVCWHAGWTALHTGKSDAEVFLKELVWREFAYHLVHHTPEIEHRSWRPGWDSFPWNTDEDANVIAWKHGRTGIPFVDAAMRQMYVTGTMHNRARMIVASYLTKHLMTHWKIGMDWFADCLIDWDPASNAMGWQWTAGSGPDAAPYFRVFNPVTQLEKFDKAGVYARAWIAEGELDPSETALSYFRAIPRSWGLAPNDPYPQPVVALDVGRNRALKAYADRNF